ncbi:molybdenum cofactor biosynthesis protein MoaE [Aeromicrobium sp. CF4.19]|uniref:molybdenum cofactor biosynthesis protein MoaE n=1 Tax=Aeromicrobium sp. CF4.19 TaxID=3373082 RepID=UPI003EE81325
METVRLTDVRDEALSLDEVFDAVRDDGAGAVVLFTGVVRDHDGGRDVQALAYSGHPTAAAQLRRVAERIAEQEEVTALAAVHRVGDLAIGDLAVVVAASAAHRDAAFTAGRRLIDELKSEVPIWKHQAFASGEPEWVHPGP